MDDRDRSRLRELLRRWGLSEWEREGLEERCLGWWPTLADYVAARLGVANFTPDDRVWLEDHGHDLIDHEEIAVIRALTADGKSAGIYVLRP